ncbi:MAG: outer-membrane lipoprotein carrier protein LolA [Segetibacter sp.]
MQLAPADKRKNFQKVNVFVDKSKMLITKAKVIDKSSNTITINLKNINTSANIADDTFVFNQKKYKKNIEVIE